MATQLNSMFSRARLDDRQVNELIGLAHGLIADGEVTTKEAEHLHKWLAANVNVRANPVAMTLLARIQDYLKDGALSDEEASDLFDTLTRFSGGDFELGEALKATALPLCSPPPPVVHEGRLFCFTGTFAFGSRRDCEAAVLERGGRVGALTLKTDFLVIGAYATDSWAHSSFGRKIERAMQIRDDRGSVRIVSEQHWIDQMRSL